MRRAVRHQSAYSKAGWTGAGVLCLLTVWWLVSRWSHPTIVASPIDTFGALTDLLGERSFLEDSLLASFGHIFAGVCLGLSFGVILGWVAGRDGRIRSFLNPLRLLLTSAPAAVVVILFLLWIGPGSLMIVVLVAVFIAPILYLALCDGFDSVDPELSEMMEFFQISAVNRLRFLVVPALLPAVLPAVRLSIANGTRLTILAEILSASSGLGEEIEQARAYLQTDRLFALLFVVIGLVAVLELSGKLLVRGFGGDQGRETNETGH